MNAPHPEPLQLLLEPPVATQAPANCCKRGHQLTPDNLYTFHAKGRRYQRCRRCSLDARKRLYQEQKEKLKAMLTISPHEAWVNRKRRERNGEPLTMADREQMTEQMEDL